MAGGPSKVNLLYTKLYMNSFFFGLEISIVLNGYHILFRTVSR